MRWQEHPQGPPFTKWGRGVGWVQGLQPCGDWWLLEFSLVG